MNKTSVLPALVCLALAVSASAATLSLPGVKLWVVDPLTHVLDDAAPCADAPEHIEIHAARGEWENGQFALRADTLVSNLSVSVSALAGPAGAAIKTASVHPLGRVRIPANTSQTALEDLVAKAPVNIPDALLSMNAFDLHSGYSQAVWLKIRVPREAAPGDYAGEITVSAADASVKIPVRLKVYDVAVPKKMHLDTVYWANFSWIPKESDQSLETQKAYWREMLRDMVAHRQNIVPITIFSDVGIGPKDSIRVIEEPGGAWRLDTTVFDMLVEMALEEGMEYISPAHLGRRQGGWNGPIVESLPVTVYGPDKAKLRDIPSYDSGDPEFKKLLSRLLPLFYTHLEQKGWRKLVLFQHLADEPLPLTMPAYNRAAHIIREIIPGLVVADASRSRDMQGGGWIPTLSLFDSDREFYKEKQAEGGLVWQYTCDNPRGKYPNFFLDYPLIRARMIAWANWRYAIPGYLNWNYNNSQAQLGPLHEPRTTAHPNSLDFCSYVTAGAPSPSVRFEATRDGREDFELLRIVALRDPEKSRDIARRVMPDLRTYVRDIPAFRLLHRELLAAAEAAAAGIDAAELESGRINWDYVPETVQIAAPPLERGKEWRLVYEGKLSDGALPSDWKAVSGEWSVRNGRLAATTAKDPKTDKPKPGDKMIVFAGEMEGDMRLEYEARSDAERPCDLSAILHCGDSGFDTGYFFGFGSDDNAFAKIMAASSELIIREETPIERGKTHRVVAQRDGNVLAQFIDGRLTLLSPDLMPLRGPGHKKFGFYLWADGEIGNIKLFVKP